ncbi:MAG: YraN family protein [Anaerolineales bacterium]|nr:YraN family protein [Chloroflexi bacterium CFX2]MCK6585276.1 YraN family protein [Anaerolineales bacterium]
MTRHNQRIGAWGESTAVGWLEERGYDVTARNVRTPYGEIDIVAKKGGVIYYIEVKTLTSSRNFFPEHQITARKREHMLNAAAHHASESGIDRWQIDVIAVEGRPGGTPVIHHFQNIN